MGYSVTGVGRSAVTAFPCLEGFYIIPNAIIETSI